MHLYYTMLKHEKKKKKFWHYKLTSCIQKYQQGASRKYKDTTTERQKGEISRSVYQCLRSRLCPCLSPLFHESSSRVKKEGMRSRRRGGRRGKERNEMRVSNLGFPFLWPVICSSNESTWLHRASSGGDGRALSPIGSPTQPPFFETASWKPVPV